MGSLSEKGFFGKGYLTEGRRGWNPDATGLEERVVSVFPAG
jgi:hypothetical protein